MPVPLTLKIFKGNSLIGSKDFSRDIIKIGRLSSAHLSLEDDKISRIHAVIQVSPDGQLSLLDMGSAEGTFVNGKRVSKGALQDGDEITLGGTRLVLELGGATQQLSDDAASLQPTVIRAPMAPTPEPMAATDGSAAFAIQPQLQPSPTPAPLAPPSYPLYQEPRTEVAYGSEPMQAAAQPEAAPVFGRRRRGSGPISDLTLSHRGRGANVEGQSDSIEDGVEVRVFWGETLVGSVLRVQPEQITIGADEKCDLVIPGEGIPEQVFPIVTSGGGETTVHFTKNMDGEFQTSGHAPVRLSDLVARGQVRAEDGGFALPLQAGGFAWVSIGANLRVEVEVTPAPKRVVAPFWIGLDYQFVNLALLASFAMLAFIISAATLPLDTDTTADDLFRNPHAMAKFVVKPPEKQKNAFAEKLKKDAGREKGEAAEKHKDKEGKMGKLNTPPSNKKSMPKAIDPNAKEIVKNSAMMKALQGGGLSTIFGNGGLGGDLKGALGNMFGPAVGDAGGMGGLGLRGAAGGGGGFGNTIGIGDIGTKGRGGGLNGYGSGIGSLGKKSGSDVAISSGNPTVEGSMDKELIRRVIHEHQSQVRYCYESELQKHQGLNGKVTVKFVIGPQGQVLQSGIESSTLDNSAVEQCIVARIYQWQFPKPKGGGIVQVNYPFLLKQSGD